MPHKGTRSLTSYPACIHFNHTDRRVLLPTPGNIPGMAECVFVDSAIAIVVLMAMIECIANFQQTPQYIHVYRYSLLKVVSLCCKTRRYNVTSTDGTNTGIGGHTADYF